MFQGGHQKVILGVILVFLLAIFELNIIYNSDEPYLLHEEVSYISVQYLNPLAGKINYTNTDKEHPNLPPPANDKKHHPKELKQEVIMEQSEKIQQSVKQEPVQKIKQSEKTQLPGNINQGDKKQPPLPPVTSNPLQQLVNLIDTKPGMYNSYLKTLSTSQLKSVIDQLGLCNLTLQKSQMQFLSCGGKSLLKQLKGKQPNSSVHMPSSFHRCKNMSFKSSGPSVALASYPGSGNSWVRQLLESATGIYTGAIYCDPAYLKAGMIGESVATSNVLAVKTHVPLFTGKNVLGKLHHDKAIYIVRNPFDAFLADHNRALATRAPRVYGNAHTAEVSYKYVNNPAWNKEVKKRSQDWKVHITQWLNVTQIPVLVVGFENLKNDTYTELKRMLDFLGYPYSEDNVLCAIKSPTETFHRKHKKDLNVFSPELQKIIVNDIKQVNAKLLKHNISLL